MGSDVVEIRAHGKRDASGGTHVYTSGLTGDWPVLPLRLCLGDAVSFLDCSHQLIILPIDDVDIVIG